MIVSPTPIAGLLALQTQPSRDDRGSFARLACADVLAAHGVAFVPRQVSSSRNPALHTLRGMHWQAEPHGEAKLVVALTGALYDVAVDLRPGSASFGAWFGAELDGTRRNGLFIPAGFAHGFLTLAPETEVLYAIDAAYAPEAVRGARFDDPAFAIAWPAAPAVIGARDLAWPAFAP